MQGQEAYSWTRGLATVLRPGYELGRKGVEIGQQGVADVQIVSGGFNGIALFSLKAAGSWS